MAKKETPVIGNRDFGPKLPKGFKRVTTEALFDLDAAPAIKSLTDFGERMRATADAARSALVPLSATWNLLTATIGSAVAAGQRWAAMASAAEQAERGLAAAAKLRGDLTGQATRGVLAYNEQLEKSLGIDGDMLAVQQKRLLAMGVEVDRLQEATKASLGLAQVTGSLEGAATLVAKAYDGNVKALKRYGIAAKDSEDAIRKSAELFKLVEANANTYSSRVAVLEQRIEELQKGLGRVITESEGVNKNLETTALVVDAATPLIIRFARAWTDAATSPGADPTSWDTLSRAIRNIGEDADSAAEKAERFKKAFREESGLDSDLLAQQYLGAVAPVAGEAGSNLSNHPLVSGAKSRVSIPNPVGSRTNPKKASGREQRLSDAAEDILAQGELENEVDQQIADQRAQQQEEIEEARRSADEYWKQAELAAEINHLQAMADLHAEALISERESVDEKNAIRAHDFELYEKFGIDFQELTKDMNQREIAETDAILERASQQLASARDVAGGMINTLAGAGNQMLMSLGQTLASGSGNVKSIIFNTLADLLLALGSFFAAQSAINASLIIATEGGTAPQAIGFGLAAAAAFAGAGALKGFANKKSGGGAPAFSSGGFAGSGSFAGAAGGGGGGGGSAYGFPSASSRRGSDQPSITYQVNVSGVIGDDTDRMAQRIEEILRNANFHPGARS